MTTHDKTKPDYLQAARPFFPAEDRRIILRELDGMLASGQLTMGPWVDKLEQTAASMLNNAYTVATNSGTSALEMLLRYFDVRDREVIVPTNTFVASANAVLMAGGQPVLADIEAATLALSPKTLEQRISPRTGGVIVVHIAGLISPRMDEIKALCKGKGLFCIEDAAHAFGAACPGGAAGDLADGAAFSLFPTKPVTSGEGGLVVTRDRQCAQFARSYRCHGIDAEHKCNDFIRLGHNFRMSEITALVGETNMRRSIQARRLKQHVADAYMNFFAGSPCTFPLVPKTWTHSWYKFPLTLPAGIDVNAIRAACKKSAIACQSCYWPPVHRQPFYASREQSAPGMFPCAEDVLARTISLPIFAGMTEDQIERVCHTVIAAVKAAC
ncbi:MAG: hypothetical protein GF398_15245 [Chitinivibrionales bacterium]|nr:hypothetical protein [Chitinivibrionales bacterium]